MVQRFNLTRSNRPPFAAALFCSIVMVLEDLIEVFNFAWMEALEQTDAWEFLVLGSLILAIIMLGLEIVKFLRHQETLEDKINSANQAFEELITAYFDSWGFSDAERDVTRLILKGCSISEIATIRDAKVGTVKAQTNSIYKKSGYKGKNPAFVRIFGRPHRRNIGCCVRDFTPSPPQTNAPAFYLRKRGWYRRC